MRPKTKRESGTITLSLPLELIKELREIAEKDQRKLSTTVRLLLKRAMDNPMRTAVQE